jgi:putative mRNA 3-end processing factor
MNLVIATPQGLYCPPGDFYIDPWRPVDRAVITHAHADHARRGHRHYLAAAPGEGVLRSRMGEISLDALPYGQKVVHNGVTISLHPAGHVLGSSQVRIEYRGEVWVASGDYKIGTDPTCLPFEPVRCHTFITESTFGLPIYRWQSDEDLFAEINAWWRDNADAGRASVVYAYAFGKAQRVIAGVDPSIGTIVIHGAVDPLNTAYRAAGVPLPPAFKVTDIEDKALLRRCLVVAPPSAQGTPWLRRFGEYSDGFASGWMQVRGAQRRRGVDRGFVMSDHADWPGLQYAIKESGADTVYVTHGSVGPMVRWLTEQGYEALSFTTEYGDEEDDSQAEAPSEPAAASANEPAGGSASDTAADVEADASAGTAVEAASAKAASAIDAGTQPELALNAPSDVLEAVTELKVPVAKDPASNGSGSTS